MEREFRDKNQYILNLAQKRANQEEGATTEGGDDKENDRFLNRLTSAANFGHHHAEEDDEDYDPEPAKNTVSHDEWVRRKEHEEKLKAKLI